jgi:alpha-N-arabinofuranosidase
MPGYAIDDTSQYTGKNNVNYIDSAAAWDEKAGRLTVFVINRNESESYPLELDIRGFADITSSASTKGRFTKCSHYEMYSKDFDAKSSAGHDWKAPAKKSVTIKEGITSTKVQPLSWNVIIFE